MTPVSLFSVYDFDIAIEFSFTEDKLIFDAYDITYDEYKNPMYVDSLRSDELVYHHKQALALVTGFVRFDGSSEFIWGTTQATDRIDARRFGQIVEAIYDQLEYYRET